MPCKNTLRPTSRPYRKFLLAAVSLSCAFPFEFLLTSVALIDGGWVHFFGALNVAAAGGSHP